MPSTKAWSQFTEADYTPEQYRRACLIVMGDTKADMKLPVREPDGMLNCNGVHAAAGALVGARGGVQASAAQKRTAAKALIRLYGQCDDQPPDSLRRLASG